MLTLTTSLLNISSYIKRIGVKTIQKLTNEIASTLEQSTSNNLIIEDLLLYLPFRYEDRSHLFSISNLTDGIKTSIEVEINTNSVLPISTKTGKKLSIFRISASNDSGKISAIWWNQPYLATQLISGQRIVLYGEWKYSKKYNCLQVENAEYELLGDLLEEIDLEEKSIHTGRIVPIYRKLGNFRTRSIRTLMYSLLKETSDSEPEFLPLDLINQYNLSPRLEAFRQIHFPQPNHDIEIYQKKRSSAHARLAIEEFFLLSVIIFNRRRYVSKSNISSVVMKIDDHIRNTVRNILPFKLTNGQKRVTHEIANDLISEQPMHRLLQGDVGAGKTIVAIQAIIIAIENGYQVAMMAPTEILVEQHTANICRILQNTGYRIASLTGSLKSKEKESIRDALVSSKIDLIIGTQSLIQDSTEFARLGLVIIDEQHRFGVMQRTKLTKQVSKPNILVMTATPIPRSLAMTAYGDLDISILDELPPGRQFIQTVIRTNSSRNKIYDFIRSESLAGHQTYIVFPLVEESEKMDLKAATDAAESLKDIFPDLTIGLLHGKMKSELKEKTMAEFAANKYHILVSTTVIEVGIDVPNASVMLIEHPERFGLAQLHQLRGRIGRGTAKSYCILLTSNKSSKEAKERLNTLASTQDGFLIAERDLEIRGPGEVLGTKQSGVPFFRVGNIVRDRDWLEAARKAAHTLNDSKEKMHLLEKIARKKFPQQEDLD